MNNDLGSKEKLLYQLTDWLHYRVEHKYADMHISESARVDFFDQEVENLIYALDKLVDSVEGKI